MAQMVSPQTSLDLQILLQDRLEMQPKEFEKKFDVEEADGKLILKVHRDGSGKFVWLERHMWSVANDYVRELGGSYFKSERKWEIPIKDGTDSEATNKDARNEIQTPPEVKPYEGMRERIEKKIEGPIPLSNPTISKPVPMPDFAEGKMTLEELSVSEKQVGQIFPVIKDQHGNILDGFHRKRINPDWKETQIEVNDPLQALRIRVHSNIIRRNLAWKEKHEWVMDARRLLSANDPMAVSQEEVAKAIGMSREWVKKYEKPTLAQHTNVEWKERFLGYNVWGFKDESWRKHVALAPKDMPDKEFYHGTTPPFVIHQLIKMFQPKTMLDSMAGVGTTGYVCKQYGAVDCDLFDLYPYPKYDVKQGDAELIETSKKYDLVFNHIPYFRMVKYGDNQQDLSTLNQNEFFAKLERIFKKNHALLNEKGIYAVLVGDWRHKNQLVPLMAHLTMIGLRTGFVLYDEAVTITSQQKSSGLREYRATKHSYLAQTFDMLLIFRKG